MTMIPQLVALHLNLSHFERKYLHNNGVNEWFGGELTQVLWRIWFGNDKYGDPSKTQRSQVLSISL